MAVSCGFGVGWVSFSGYVSAMRAGGWGADQFEDTSLGRSGVVIFSMRCPIEESRAFRTAVLMAISCCVLPVELVPQHGHPT